MAERRASQRRQTSVRVSPRAMQALWTIAARRKVSPGEAVRQLLTAHIQAQAARQDEERLTHISTVLRYPPPPVRRGEPDGRVRLAMRLDDGVAARARELAVTLPGQAAGRAHQDYGARPLTDAVVSAIACEEPFVDNGLEGLPPLLTKRTAHGLWGLTVAATLGRAERWVLHSPGPADDVEIALREEGVAWHHPWRFEVALQLARALFTGPEAAANLEMVTRRVEPFRDLCRDLELAVDLDHHLLKGLPRPDDNVEGRSGSAVWRAERRRAEDDVARWLTAYPLKPTLRVEPPGWELHMPAGWCGYPLEFGQDPPPPLQAHLDAGRVMKVEWRSRTVLWPLDAASSPIAGIDAVISGAQALTPDEPLDPAVLAEIILVDRQHLGRSKKLYVPAEEARRLGFIAQAEHDHLIAVAAEMTATRVQVALSKAERLDEPSRRALREAASEPARFVKLAARSGIKCSVVPPTWPWPIESVTAALNVGTSWARLEWLGGITRLVLKRHLERSMERAWNEAFRLGEPPWWDPV